MSRTIYALLIAIDDYSPPVPKLRGCVNDIDAFATYLSERIAKDRGVSLQLKTLKNGEATRQAVVDAYRDHLGQAKKGDVALFYYSGHGSQEQAPEEFWKLEPDHLDETLVLFDSRGQGSWDLADKEIAKLIGEVAANGPHVAVILDCCHSGSGTREIDTVVRRAPTDTRRRPIETFLVSLAEAEAASASRSAKATGASRYTPPEGRHVLFAACRDDEEAKEYSGDGKQRGAFSFFLGDALKSAAGVPTYRDLFARTSALVSNVVRNQSPQLEASQNDDLDATFLDGAIQPAPATFTASCHEGHWRINGGATSGIPAPAGSDAPRLALYPFDAPAADLNEPSKAVAMARVDEVLPASSSLVIEKKAELDPKTTYKAVVVSLPTPRLSVLLEGDAVACDLVREALKTATPATPERKPSLFIREASKGDTPEFRLLARENQLVITRPNDERPLVGQIVGLNEDGAKRAVARLEHMTRWTQTARLSNPASSIHPSDVKLTVLVDDKEVSGREIRLEYQLKDGEQVAPTFKVSMTNNSKRTLYCGLLDLTQRYQVDAGLLKAGCVKLEPGETAWGNLGDPISASVPDEVWKQGVIEYKDLLKLIVCTEEFDARLLEQPKLDMPGTRGGTKGIARNGSLNRLMQKIQTRELVASDPGAIDDWQATEVSFTTVRPLATTSVPAQAQDAAVLNSGVKLEGHPALKAKARLSSAPLATRDLSKVTLPRLLYDDPSVCQPLTFTVSRGSDPGLSVLELTDVNDSSVVTPDAPLRMTVPLELQTNEHVVPVAFDGEFFLPLGRVESRSADETVIALERLPAPVVDSRSLTGAIKIFFQKVISKKVGLDFAYPILGAADVAHDGTVKPIRDTFQIRDRVAKAQRILLFVHGIIGDTESMVPSVQLAKLADARPLASLYDLVLTFDYENLNTTIEDNARLLKKRLEAVGLASGDGKSLDIVAHSMGGLVSRWFIEREGGNQIARRLVMLGTPNGGSPWPRIFDWATVALALGLNHLTAIAWPASVVGGLAAWMENPTVALNEMLPDAGILSELNKSADPGKPYIMLAGNTSIIPVATEATGIEKGSRLGRLLARLTSPDLLRKVANPFFLDQANDIAVSVASMENIAPGRKPPYDVRPVACDHLSYFRDPEGLKALAAVLAESV
jgi:pimeloyl-ACP methyl ester carboxylesterase